MADKKEKKTGGLTGSDILLAILIALIGGIGAFLLILVSGSLLAPDVGRSQTADQPPAATQTTPGTLPSITPPPAATPTPAPTAEPDRQAAASTAEPSQISEPEPSMQPSGNPADAQSGNQSGNSGGQGNADNFYTYNNPEQQQTNHRYVLNTSTMKFHIPSCADVARIAPANYVESSLTREQIVNNGYSPCGHCGP